jgi:hypothetical protein
MGNVRLIETCYVFNVDYNGVEYEATCSEDLKSIYEVYPENVNKMDILEIIQNALFNEGIENFD